MAIPIAATITPLGTHAGQFTLAMHGATGLWIPSLQNQVDTGQRLGQLGDIGQTIGQIGRRTPVTGWYGDYQNSTMITYITNWEAVEGEICQIVDGWGRTIPRVRLSDMVAIPKVAKGVLLSAGLQSTIHIALSFTAVRLPNS